MLEKQIEAKVCAYAKERGLLVYKFTSPARAAVPDRMFVLPSGKIFFCEFKRGGEKATSAQEREHHRLRQHKVVVYVIDDVFSGLRMVDDMIAYANP
jgi:hypothetical protein